MPVTFDSKPLLDAVRQAALRAVVRSTELVREEAIALILTTEKNGRVYRHHGVEHQASAPGEPPASDTGRLVNAIETEYDTRNLTGSVVVTVGYGLWLEFGTQKMEPRPFLRPALANKQDEINQIMADEGQRALK